ncbi:hypothetical protein [Tsukamurella pulmonis]|uniref:hypothetical protein n=1 Tax=Tsukamurella pulmonis TaxID=47312 RepID=UPI000E097AE0|nr:hypothetical protein [Tsukamurella pulmonis]RDH13870.1 hypothetical protein DVB88_00185 [Tsukamurella pulmonis]
MGRRIKRESTAPVGTSGGTIDYSPEQWPAGCDPAPTDGSFRAELAWALQPCGITPEDLERGGHLNPFTPEGNDGFLPFETREFLWPTMGTLRRCTHRREIEAYLWERRQWFDYRPKQAPGTPVAQKKRKRS